MEHQELLWRQYALQVELFKHYMKLAVDFNVFYYGITGAVVSYYLAHSSEPYMQYALALPIGMSIFFGLFFVYGTLLMKIVREDIFKLRDRLGLEVAPDGKVLSVFLLISAALMSVVAVALILLWLRGIA